MWPNPDDPHEPQWLEEDAEAALDWLEYEQNKCPGCGRQRDECFADDGPDYTTTPLVCWACQDRDNTARQYQKGNGDTAGVFFVTEEVKGGRDA